MSYFITKDAHGRICFLPWHIDYAYTVIAWPGNFLPGAPYDRA